MDTTIQVRERGGLAMPMVRELAREIEQIREAAGLSLEELLVTLRELRECGTN